MARAKKKKRKVSEHQRKFGTVAKATNAVCHRETNSVAAYKRCMSAGMKLGLKKAGVTKKKGPAAAKRGAAKKSSGMLKCAGIVKSGAKKGKIKKGYRFPGGGKCPVKAG